MSKLYCVECPFPGGGNSSDNSPWIAVLLRAFHNISGYAVAFFFSQFLLRAPLSANATAKHRLKRKIAQLCLFGGHLTAVTYGLSSYCDNWILGPRSPIPRTPIQRPALTPVSPPGAISFRGADGRGRFNRSDTESPLLGCWAPLPACAHKPKPRSAIPQKTGRGFSLRDSTLCGAVHIECLCCCVSVPAQGWASSSRVCHHPLRPRLPVRLAARNQA